MDAVKSFNSELSSLYEVKPPISKAKMTALTRGAIKAIKFYKHVVQSVEKFILKCKPEYKVPGLYVIDSIVRQSRHQFGADKDVFAPRFAKNMQQTFVNLFKCPPEDKSKVIRVLNLWQKNQVFAPDVIQPLFDLADPNHPIHKEISAAMQQQANNNGVAASGAAVKGSPALQKTPTKTTTTSDTATLAQLGNIANNAGALDPNTLAQLQQLHRLLMRQAEAGSSVKQDGSGQPVHFDRKLLDFDYGSDEEEDPTNPSPKNQNNPIESVGSLLSNPEVLRQLQTLQQSMMNNPEIDLEKIRKLQEMKQQEDEFDKHLAQTVPNLPFASEIEFKPSNTNSPAVISNFFLPAGADLSQPPPGYKIGQATTAAATAATTGNATAYDITQNDDNAAESEVEFIGANDDEVIHIDHGDSRSPSRERYRRRRSRSKDRSRERTRDRRRRSRSRSRSRNRRHRTRSRERERKRTEKKEEQDEKDKEKEKERKKRGLPPIKKDNLSVCSTTLWVGHLSKLVHQEDLSDTFGEFGEIVSIDLIIPRGCAFIVMHRRQDAARCLTKLKNHKMQGKAITLAWAPGKGVKGKELKDYWEGDLGVSYIPYSKLKPDMDFELLEDGGMIDEDTLPVWLKEHLNQNNNIKKEENSSGLFQIADANPGVVDTSQPPPVPTTGLLQAPPMTLPLVAPFQFQNNRLLGMMPNVPMGVPPPTMLSNQILGLGSAFGQGLLHPPLGSIPTPLDNKTGGVGAAEGLPFAALMPPQPPPLALQPPQHEDNMDIEMEDAEKPQKSEPRGGYEERRERNRSRERDRDRDRDRNSRGRRNSRERRSGSDRERERERDSSNRRDRNNRWSERRDSREDRRDREKTLNDRLREMAGDNSYREEKEHPPPLLERPPSLFDNPDRFIPPPLNRRNPHPDFLDAPPALEFEPPPGVPGPARDFPDFEPPPPPPRVDFDGYDRMDFEEPPVGDFRGGMMHRGGGDRFDDRRRNDFFPPGREGFGGPRGGGRFRGPDGFGPPRGGPMMRPPHMFHPRGPHMRGPRPGPWMDGGPPMRPNFPPRFDGPPEFFRGGGGPPPFDEPPHPRHRHRDDRDRRRFRPDFNDDQEPPQMDFERPPERRSRWGNSSPQQEEQFQQQEDPQREDRGDCERQEEPQEIFDDNDVAEDNGGNEEAYEEVQESNGGNENEVAEEGEGDGEGEGEGGNTTPLHDEPEDIREEACEGEGGEEIEAEEAGCEPTNEVCEEDEGTQGGEPEEES